MLMPLLHCHTVKNFWTDLHQTAKQRSLLAELYIAEKIGYPVKNILLQNVKLLNKNLKTANKPHHTQCHHLQSLEYLAIIQTSFGPWILALHKNKNRKPALPLQKCQLQVFSQQDSFDAVDESSECRLSITPANVIAL